jgi:hypothetical protein
MATHADIPARGDARAEAAAELAVDVDRSAVVDADDLRDAAGSLDEDDAAPGSGELPLEADPADVAEQDVAVPYDDEEREER